MPHLQEVCWGKISPVSAEKSSHFNWFMVFGRESSAESIRTFFADVLSRIPDALERERQVLVKQEWFKAWLEAQHGVVSALVFQRRTPESI